jgi:hypothetical protein
MRRIPLEQQIDEVAREISLRAAVYPRLISNGKLAQPHAAEHIARMRAALGTLKRLRRKPARAPRSTTRRRP